MADTNCLDKVNKRKLAVGAIATGIALACFEATRRTYGAELHGLENTLAGIGELIGNSISYATNYIAHRMILNPTITEYAVGIPAIVLGIKNIYRAFVPEAKEEK